MAKLVPYWYLLYNCTTNPVRWTKIIKSKSTLKQSPIPTKRIHKLDCMFVERSLPSFAKGFLLHFLSPTKKRHKNLAGFEGPAGCQSQQMLLESIELGWRTHGHRDHFWYTTSLAKFSSRKNGNFDNLWTSNVFSSLCRWSFWFCFTRSASSTTRLGHLDDMSASAPTCQGPQH